MKDDRLPIVAIVLTHNEEKNLAACLESVKSWVCRIVVVDSGSTDTTLAIAHQFGAETLSHPFENHAKQWRWALENLRGEPSWILGLDADQQVTWELQDELRLMFATPSAISSVDGFYVKRREIFRGRWIRHGGYYPKYLLKLFRRDKVFVDVGELTDHHFYVPGRTVKLQRDIVEDNQKEVDLSFWIEKHTRYARLQALQELGQGNQWAQTPRIFGNPDERVLWFKRCWYRMPLYIRPFLYFVYRYFLRLGFLDGKEGFVFHFLHAWWFRLLVDVYREEIALQTQRAEVDPPHQWLRRWCRGGGGARRRVSRSYRGGALRAVEERDRE
jgi:glycosyltransferase involved in cell wall biosynthesis